MPPPEPRSRPRLAQYKFVQLQAAVDSSSTLSTNATADNLAGPGRTVGLLYNALGTRLEALLARRLPSANRSSRHDSSTIANFDTDALVVFERTQALGGSVDSISLAPTLDSDTNATADNLVGPGRTLGLLFHFLGRKLEARASQLAAGRGPDAAVARIQARVAQRRKAISSSSSSYYLSAREFYAYHGAARFLLEKGEFVKELQALLAYAQ